MYDIDELERTWKRYRMRRLVKISAAGATLLAVAGLVAYLAVGRPFAAERNDTDAGVNRGALNATKESAAAAPSASTSNASSPSPGSEKPLAPTVPSLDRDREPPKSEKPRRSKPKISIVVSDRNGKPLNSAESERPKVHLQVNEAKNSQVVKQIERRFLTTRDYDDAIYLAKHYYRKKLYKKAEYWAMQANTIDTAQEESWLIFAKAKAKRGRRVDALKVLQAYYERSGSARAKDLIDRIRKGKSY